MGLVSKPSRLAAAARALGLVLLGIGLGLLLAPRPGPPLVVTVRPRPSAAPAFTQGPYVSRNVQGHPGLYVCAGVAVEAPFFDELVVELDGAPLGPQHIALSGVQGRNAVWFQTDVPWSARRPGAPIDEATLVARLPGLPPAVVTVPIRDLSESR